MLGSSQRQTIAAFALTLAGCSSSPTAPGGATVVVLDFGSSARGFVAGFADYPPANEAGYFLQSGHLLLPVALSGTGRGLFISGVNHSDDLFMFYKGRISGLLPNTLYRGSFVLEFATNVPTGCFGVAGAPGESVYVKAGVTRSEC